MMLRIKVNSNKSNQMSSRKKFVNDDVELYVAEHQAQKHAIINH